jgi:glyoxylase-like metal-dependent hydrolase (beta-lactamase superfamily II)
MTEQLILKQAQVGPWPMNAYALMCPETRQSVLIDPGAEPDVLQKLLDDSTPVAILLTHAHPDHIGALDEMKARLDVPVYINPGEPRLGLPVDDWLNNGDTFAVGNFTLRIIHTPGHTAGMVTLMLPDGRAVVGDTIFQGGPGRTWAPEEFAITLETMRNIVFQWPDETECFPGHGPSFLIGDERPAYEAFVRRGYPADLQGDVSWNMDFDE